MAKLSGRVLLEKHILPRLAEPICYSPALKAKLSDLIRSVKSEGLEGLVAKRRNSLYEPGQRSGAWRKLRINRAQEFVIGGYTPSDRNFDALIFGYYSNGKLRYVARTLNGFADHTPADFQASEASGNSALPVCKPARSEARQMGRGTNSSNDEEMPMGEAGSGGSVRVHGMDTG